MIFIQEITFTQYVYFTREKLNETKKHMTNSKVQYWCDRYFREIKFEDHDVIMILKTCYFLRSFDLCDLHFVSSSHPAVCMNLKWIPCRLAIPSRKPGFVQVLEILESPWISGNHFPGLKSPGILMLVLESPGNLNLAASF